MQATADGEFYPEKNLDRSYKIPRRNIGDMASNPAALPAASAQNDNKGNQVVTPLANSYYNYPYDPRAASAYYQNFQFFQEYGNLPGQVAGFAYSSAGYNTQMISASTNAGTTVANACNQNSNSSQVAGATGYYKPGEYNPNRGVKRPNPSGPQQRGPINFNAPPPPPPAIDSVEPIKQNIYNTLRAIKEKPKTYGKNVYNANSGGNSNEGNDEGFDRDNQGYANQRYSNQGLGNKGYGNEKFNNQGQGYNKGFSNEGYGNQEFHNQEFNDEGYGNQRFNNQGFNRGVNNNQRFSNQEHNKGANNEGYNNQKSNNEGYNKGINNESYDNQEFNDRGYNRGFNNEGYGNQRFNDQKYNKGFNNEGFGNQRYNKKEFDEQGYDNQGYGNQRNNAQGFDNQGYDDQGYDDQEYDNQRYKQRFGNRGYGNQKDNFNEQVQDAADNQRVKKQQGYETEQQFNRQGVKRNYENYGYDDGRNDQAYDNKGYDEGYNNRGFKEQRFNQGSNNYQRYNNKQEFNKWKKPVKKPAVEPPVEQTVPDLLDETLPKDLKMLFQPLYCKLCSIQLSSNQSAKMHYRSKNHEKKIRKWLQEWSEKTGEPLHKRAIASTEKKEVDAEKNPTWFRCEVCDLELTGKLHAESHYMGRNHQKAVMGHKNPSGTGYYKDGKWVRVKNQKSKSYDFEKGEDNFGADFKKDEAKSQENSSATEPPAPKKKKEPQLSDKYRCEVCNVNTTCQDQLDTHFRGQKHMKKLKLLGMDIYLVQRNIIEAAGETAEILVPASTPNMGDPQTELDINLAVYRTPSGDYYCPVCNISTNSEPQFLQHMRSKGHSKKATQKKAQSNAPSTPTTAQSTENLTPST